MAEEEKMLLGVEFAGAPGVNQFLAAMGVLPGRLNSLFGEMGKGAPGATETWSTKGAQVARAYLGAVQAELAGFKGFGGDGLVNQVMKGAGLDRAQMNEMRGVLKDFAAMQRQSGTGAFASKDFDQASVLGLTGAKRNVADVNRETERLNATLDRTTRQFDALKAASATGIRALAQDQGKRILSTDSFGDTRWSKWAQEQAKAQGMPLPQAPQIGSGADAQRQAAALYDAQMVQQMKVSQAQLRSAREQAEVLKNAPILQSRPDPIQRVMAPVIQATTGAPSTPLPTDRQRAIAEARAEGLSGKRVRTEGGYTRGEIAKVDTEYAGLIQAIKEEAAARRLAARRAESNARVARLESADLAAGRTSGMSAAELAGRDARVAAMRARVEANVAESRAARDARPTGMPIIPAGSAEEARRRRELIQPAAPLSDAQIRANREASTRALGGGVSWGQQFRAGFQGPQTSSTAEMLGQTARISLFYGAAYRGLSLLQDALTNVTQETLQYEGALTDLAVATNRSRSENADLASTLGDTAASAGYGASLGVQGGAKAIGLFSAANLSQEEQERVATTSFRVASQVARVAGSNDPVAVQTQLAGAARSFGYGVDRLTDIQDAITYISRNTGQAPTELLGATSNIATLGRSSGFDPEQLMAIVAQVGTTTGQNPEATAGQFRQVLSREFDTVAKAATDIFGIDTSNMATTADVIAAVAGTSRTQDQTNSFSSVFGKGGSQTVAMITLENWDRIQTLATGATGAQGVGQETFNKVMRDVGQQLRVFGTDASNLGLKLVETGVMDWLVLVIGAADGLVTALSGMLDLFNEIPRPIRSVGFALAEVALAAAAFRTLGARSAPGVAGRVANAGYAGVAAAQAAAAAGRASAVAGGRSGTVGALGGFASFLRGQGQLTMSAADRAALRNTRLIQPRTGLGGAFDRIRTGGDINPATGRASGLGRVSAPLTGLGFGVAAVGLAVAAQQTIESFKRVEEAGDLLSAAQRNSAMAITEAQYLDAAAQAGAAAQTIEDGQYQNLKVGDFGGVIPSLISSLTTGDESSRLRELEALNTQRAAEAAARQKAAEDNRPSAVFTDFSETGINDTLKELTERGYNAREQLQMLSEALFTFSDAAATSGQEGVQAVVARTQFDQAAGDIASSVTGAFGVAGSRQQANKEAIEAARWTTLGGFSLNQPKASDGSTLDQAKERMNLLLDDDRLAEVNGAVRDSVLEQLNGMGDLALLKDADFTQIEGAAAAAAQDSFSPEEWAALGEDVQKELIVWINKAIADSVGAFGGKLTANNIGAFMRILPDLAKNEGALVEQETGSATQGAGAELAALERERANIATSGLQSGFSDDDVRKLREVDAAIATAKRNTIALRISDIQRYTSYRTSFVAEDDVLGRLAIESEGLKSQSDIANKAYTDSVKQDFSKPYPSFSGDQNLLQQKQDVDAQAAVKDREAQAAELARTQAQVTAGANPASGIGMAGAQVNNARTSLEAATDDTAAWYAAQAAYKGAMLAYSQAQIQAANGNALAAVDPRDTTGRIAVQISNARREMSILPRGEQGALRDQINGLNQQMQEALVSQANAAASAGIAGRTGGLEQARVAIENATRTLGIQLPGTEGYYSALAGLRSAQAQLAEQERTQADRVRRLGSDLTDPVAQATLDVQQALETYWANAQAGEGADVLGQNQLDITGARNREESAMFSQRLSDTQIAEDLGRISHSQYMSYLQSEHDRLNAVANRTRQQQDQLNQVDQLMKSAAEEMQGQWNIGDIDLPTAYEMRRAIGTGAPTSVADYSNSNNIVNLNGVDFATVVQYLENMLGTGAQGLRTTATRKV